jgi:hypothetical protein
MNSLNILCPCRSCRPRPCLPPPTPCCCSRDAACMPRAPSFGALCWRHTGQAGRLLECPVQQPRFVGQREHTKVVLLLFHGRASLAAMLVFFWGLQRTFDSFFLLCRQTCCSSVTTAAVSLDSLTSQVWLRECTGRCHVRSLPLLHQLSPTHKVELCVYMRLLHLRPLALSLQLQEM